MNRRVVAAIERAREDARLPAYSGGPRGRLERRRHLAIGDPQAPLATFFEILDAHGALGEDGRLADDVHLVSMGDHFDWGDGTRREEAARSAVELLAWLAVHPPDKVTLLAGNHDLARVAELACFDDAAFGRARAEAHAIYRKNATDPAAERAFIARYPALPGAEAAARDFATFRTEQRPWVVSLLRARRFSAAAATSHELLLTHAGVTRDDLAAAGVPEERHADAFAVADALNAALDAAVAAWPDGTSLRVPPLFEPGSAASGETRGIFSQRPCHPDVGPPDDFAGPPRRRFDPRCLPRGLTQAVGHIKDDKCRALLGPWAAAEEALDGPIRHLRVRGAAVRYARGLPQRDEPDAATILFLDGGMLRATPQRYELLDLDTRRPASRVR